VKEGSRLRRRRREEVFRDRGTSTEGTDRPEGETGLCWLDPDAMAFAYFPREWTSSAATLKVRAAGDHGRSGERGGTCGDVARRMGLPLWDCDLRTGWCVGIDEPEDANTTAPI
jgi:hypothetical protein